MKLNQLTLVEAQTGLKQQKFSSHELTQACLEQINSTDKKIHAFLTLNPQAAEQAKKADKEIKSTSGIFTKKPLIGIPYALKDNFLTSGIKTTAAAKLLGNFIPQYDATVYSHLQASGAILLGKTNMDAWAHGSSTETSDYGSTKNPWNLKHLPGGSSGGSAAAVIADQCIFAIGSETAGSIRQPAAWSGVTGFKPTYGRVSRYGVIAMASSTDSPGPITKTALDAAIISQIISGKDLNDATSSSNSVNMNLINTTKQSLKNLNIAIPKEYMSNDVHPQVIKLINQSAKKLESLGANIKEVSLLDPQYSIGVYTIVQRCEVSSNLARFDGIRYGKTRDNFSYEAKNRCLLGTFILSSRMQKDDQHYVQAQKVRTMIVNDFNKLFKSFDLYLGPTSPGPALKVGATKDNPLFGEVEDRLVEASSIAGLTGISIPSGFINNLPIGLQLTGPQFSEQKVLQTAHTYQTITNHHKKRPILKT